MAVDAMGRLVPDGHTGMDAGAYRRLVEQGGLCGWTPEDEARLVARVRRLRPLPPVWGDVNVAIGRAGRRR